MSCDHDWFNATRIGDPRPVDVCRLCGARSDDPAVIFQRAWDVSSSDPRALQMIERGSVWRVYEKPYTELRPSAPGDYGMIELRIIELRSRRIGNNDPLWVIEARFEGDSAWTEVTTGRMVW